MENEVEISYSAKRTRIEHTYNLKGPNCAARAHFNARYVYISWLSVIELNQSDREEGEVQPWKSLQ